MMNYVVHSIFKIRHILQRGQGVQDGLLPFGGRNCGLSHFSRLGGRLCRSFWLRNVHSAGLPIGPEAPGPPAGNAGGSPGRFSIEIGTISSCDGGFGCGVSCTSTTRGEQNMPIQPPSTTFGIRTQAVMIRRPSASSVVCGAYRSSP